jgi:hypothetical protein
VNKIAFLMVFGLASASASAAEKVELKLKYPEGRGLVLKTESTNVTDAAGMRITQVHAQEIEERVLKNNAQESLLRLTFLRQAIRTESPMGSVSFDSSNENQVPVDINFAGLNALVGESFEVRLDPSGGVLDIQGTEALIQNVREALPSDLPESAMAELMASFDDESFSNSIREQRQMLPTEAVGPGGTWSNSVGVELPGVGAMTTVTDYTLEGVSKKGSSVVATIDYVLRAELSEGNVLLDGFDVSGTGVAHLDLTQGFFIDNRSEVRMTGEVQGMPMVVISTMSMEQQVTD